MMVAVADVLSLGTDERPDFVELNVFDRDGFDFGIKQPLAILAHDYDQVGQGLPAQTSETLHGSHRHALKHHRQGHRGLLHGDAQVA